MPICRLLTNIELAPEARQVLEIALNYALRKLALVD